MRNEVSTVPPPLAERPFVITWDSLLLGGDDAKQRFARFPQGFTVKGLFFQRLFPLLGTALAPADLIDPPRGNVYLPFRDYPQVDYSRLAYIAARRRFNSVSAAEAMRELSRADYQLLASSRPGKIALAFTGGVEDVLMKLPSMYAMAMRGGTVKAHRETSGVRLEFRDWYGWVDCYPIGHIEGIVDSFGFTPRIEQVLHSSIDATYRVTWT